MAPAWTYISSALGTLSVIASSFFVCFFSVVFLSIYAVALTHSSGIMWFFGIMNFSSQSRLIWSTPERLGYPSPRCADNIGCEVHCDARSGRNLS